MTTLPCETAPTKTTAAMGTLDFGQVALKWDPKNLEIRTMSVEKTLEPLVLQVTTLVNTKGPSKKKKGKGGCEGKCKQNLC